MKYCITLMSVLLLVITATSAKQPKITKTKARTLLKKIYRVRYESAECKHCDSLAKPARSAGFNVRKNAKGVITVTRPEEGEDVYQISLQDALMLRKGKKISTFLKCEIDQTLDRNDRNIQIYNCEEDLFTNLLSYLENIAYPR